jgi:hypothetical protein
MNGFQVAGIIEQGGYEHSSRVLKAIDRRGILLDSPEMGVIQAQDRADQNFGDHSMGDNQDSLVGIFLYHP